MSWFMLHVASACTKHSVSEMRDQVMTLWYSACLACACLLSVCMLCLGCAKGSGLHAQCGGNKGDATAMVTTNLTGLYGMADAGVKQSLWKVVCVSSDMLAAFLRGPITLTESPVKATAFLLQLQIHSDRQLFWAGRTVLGWVAEC